MAIDKTGMDFVGLSSVEVPSIMREHGAMMIDGAVTNLENDAKIYSNGSYAWASDLFAKSIQGQNSSPLLNPTSSTNLKDKDLAGADIVAGFKRKSPAELMSDLEDGLVILKEKTQISVEAIKSGKEKTATYDANLGDAEALDKRIGELQKKALSVKEKFETKSQVLKDKQEVIAFKESFVDMNDVQRAEAIADLTSKLDGHMPNELYERRTQLEKAQKEGSITSRDYADQKKKLEADTAEYARKEAVYKEQFEFATKNQKITVAQKEAVEEQIQQEQERLRSDRGRHNDEYRKTVTGLLDESRKAVFDTNTLTAQVNLAEAKQTGNRTDIEAAQERLELQQTLGAQKSPSAADQVKSAEQYRDDVAGGTKAREALKSETYSDFVDAIRPEINEAFDERIKRETAAYSNNPDKQQKIRDNINQERKEFMAKLDASQGNHSLAAQIEHVSKALESKGFSREVNNDARKRMFEAAIAANHEGKVDGFATNFLSTDALISQYTKPATLEELARSAKMNPTDIMEVKLIGSGNNARIELTRRGSANLPEDEAHATLTGDVVKRMVQNGLDLSASHQSEPTWVAVDYSSDIGVKGQKLAIHNSSDRNIIPKTTGGIVLGTIDKDPGRRDQIFASIQSVGGADAALEERAIAGGIRARVALAKKELREGTSLAKMIDIDGNKSLSQDELALLDSNKDGQIAKNEMTSGMQRALASFVQHNPDLHAQLQAMNSGQNVKIDIASLGNVPLPSAQQSTQLAQNNGRSGRGGNT